MSELVNALKESFGVTELPIELEKLARFQEEESDYECYSEGFGVAPDAGSGLHRWCEEEAFLQRLFPFAQANGAGSFYAIWNDGSDKPLDEMPIVVFGDEGGEHVVAENLKQLLQLLSRDMEISVNHDKAFFAVNCGFDEDDSEDGEIYLEWLEENFQLHAIDNPNEIIAQAQAKYQDSFKQWMAQYGR